jgi:hypothetical protein
MDHKLTFSPDRQARLADLALGAPQGPYKDLVTQLTSHPEEYPTKNTLLAAFRVTLKASKALDQTGREALADDLERILDVFGIDSSDGLLNEWVHGISL